MHGADVMLGVHLFLTEFGYAQSLSPVERLAALFAAALHDVAHPGTTNGHEVKACSELAIRYNDLSPLENHHCATAFTKLLAPKHNFLAGLGKEKFLEFRKIVVRMILATDLSKHFEILSQLKSIQNGTLGLTAPPAANGTAAAASTACCPPGTACACADTGLVLATAIKFADLGHTLKPWDQHERWSMRVSDEMQLLGDKERELGLAISPLCDRYSAADTALAENQVKFLDFICFPFYKAAARVVPPADERVRCLEANHHEWARQAAVNRGETPAPAAEEPCSSCCAHGPGKQRPSVVGESMPKLAPCAPHCSHHHSARGEADDDGSASPAGVPPPTALERAIGARMRVLGGTATQKEDWKRSRPSP